MATALSLYITSTPRTIWITSNTHTLALTQTAATFTQTITQQKKGYQTARRIYGIIGIYANFLIVVNEVTKVASINNGNIVYKVERVSLIALDTDK